MSHAQKAQNLMQRALNMRSTNPAFADRLFKAAQQEMLKHGNQ